MKRFSALTKECGSFFTIALVAFNALSAFAATPEAPAPPREPTAQPAVPGAPPEEKPLQVQSTEEGEERSHELGSSYRTHRIYPSNYGQPGLFRLRSGESLPYGALTFGIGGEFYSVTDAPAFPALLGAAGLTEANTIAESLFVGFSPVENLTLSLMRRNSSTTYGAPGQAKQLISSLGDFNFSGSYSFRVSPSFAIAPLANVLIASNFNNLAPSGTTASLGFGAGATYSLYPSTGTPLLFHANLIYSVPQIRTSKQTATLEPETFFLFSRYHTMTLGLGAEYEVGDFIPFIEWQHVVHANSGLSFDRSPSKISIGTRILPVDNKSLALLIGADVALGRGVVPGVPYTPTAGLIAQASYTFGLFTTERRHYFTTKDVNVVDRRFVIRKSIKFKVGSAILEPESTTLLDQIAEVVQRNGVKKLLIVGHTDSSHTEDYNLKLSLDRAQTVRKYLIGKGISEDGLVAQGYGKRKPRASNLSEAGRSQNRRVDFFILE